MRPNKCLERNHDSICSDFALANCPTTLLALAPRDLRGKGLEARFPKYPESVEPVVDLPQRGRVERVDTARSINPHGREPVVAEHPQVLRHGGLGDAELTLHRYDDIARGMFPGGQQLQNARSRARDC